MASTMAYVDYASPGGYADDEYRARRHEEEEVVKKRDKKDLVNCEYCQQLNDINESLDCEMCGGRLEKPEPDPFVAPKVEYMPSMVSSDSMVYAAVSTAAYTVYDTTGYGI